VDLPMTRVEVRTDEGGDSLDLAVAKIAFKELLMFRFYAEEAFGAAYTYDAEDVARARRNEEAAARRGLDADLEHPFTGEPCTAREFLAQTLCDLRPLAEALGQTQYLRPLEAMAEGAPNPAGEARAWFAARLKGAETAPSGRPVIPPDLLKEWCATRAGVLQADLQEAHSRHHGLGDEGAKLAELVHAFEEESRRNAAAPLRLGGREEAAMVVDTSDPVAEVLSLSQILCRIPSVTNCPRERLEEVWRCARTMAGALSEAGAQVRLFEGGRYPSVMAGFPGALAAPVVLGGHFDVVEPDPNDTQFEPRIEGDYLWARGAADMKTVVASDMVWLRRTIAAGPPYPPVSLLFVGNEENGESEPFGTPHVLGVLRQESSWEPAFMALGERTGEKGDELFGEICTANRGVVRLGVVARGERAHTGMAGVPADLGERLIEAREAIGRLLEERLTLRSGDGWCSAARFPFLVCGEGGVYNVTPAEARLGLEVRPIPEDGMEGFLEALRALCAERGLEVAVDVMEGGVACPPGDVHLKALVDAAAEVQGGPPRMGRKLAGTSARFAPGGRAVVWGQTGVGPHSRREGHFIPSIAPYLKILDAFGRRLLQANGAGREI
jgi:succinyl-diaminopimelate desuccinylase